MLEIAAVSEDQLDTGAGFPFAWRLFRGAELMEPIPDPQSPNEQGIQPLRSSVFPETYQGGPYDNIAGRARSPTSGERTRLTERSARPVSCSYWT